MDKVLMALSGIRALPQPNEYALQHAVAEALTAAGVEYQKEYLLGPHARIDFLCAGGVGIEIKRAKPYAPKVREQAARYLISPELNSLIVVVERSLRLPKVIAGKPVAVFGLNRLWGVAL